jgi:hypothetical protein
MVLGILVAFVVAAEELTYGILPPPPWMLLVIEIFQL